MTQTRVLRLHPVQIVFLFFGKNGIVGEALADRVHDKLAYSPIGSSYRVILSLPFNGGLVDVVFEKDLAGTERETFGCFKFCVHHVFSWKAACRHSFMDDFYSNPEIERYLKSVVGSSARIVRQAVLAKPGKKELKGYGYGTPVLIEYELEGRLRRAVLHTIRPGPFGHEHMSDRAQSLLWDHTAFNTLPRHVRSLDVGAFRSDKSADVSERCRRVLHADGLWRRRAVCLRSRTDPGYG